VEAHKPQFSRGITAAPGGPSQQLIGLDLHSVPGVALGSQAGGQQAIGGQQGGQQQVVNNRAVNRSVNKADQAFSLFHFDRVVLDQAYKLQHLTRWNF
jgi:hypothetical protein